MDKLNISNLVANANINFSGTLSVNSLTSESKKSHTLDDDIKDITRLQKERRTKKIRSYKKQLKICAERMKEANMMHRDNIIFDVPTFMFDCPEYDAEECVSYIDVELQDRHLDTRVEGLSIFVSWLYTSLHKKKS